MTVEVDGVGAEAAEWQPADVDGRPAGWWERAGAFALDVLFGLGLLAAVLLVGWSAPPQGWLWWLCMLLAAVVVLAIAANRILLPVITGWTLGRSVFGIAVVDRDGDPVGPGRLLLRDLAHLLDTVPLFLGWLWPLIDRGGRTFADMMVRTEVRQVDGPRRDNRRLAAAVVATAAGLAVLAAALGYAAVYRHQQAQERARAQISAEGPKIVADLLSYTGKTVSDDFAHAQTLVTDEYRPEVIRQQEAVGKAGPVDNDFWVSNSAVLFSSDDRAAMLLLLQGQRGAQPNPRFVTASVRAEFEKTGADWKLSNLTVLAAPKPPGALQKADEAPPKSGEAPPKSGSAPPKSGSAPPKSAPPKPAPPRTPAPPKSGEGGR